MSDQIIPQAPDNKTFKSLRDSWPVFVYEGFDTSQDKDKLKVTYLFEIPGLTKFRPELILPLPNEAFRLDNTARRLLFNIGLIELISYWKTTCAPIVRIEGGPLTSGQISFWKNLYYAGLGEFFYRNGIRTSHDDFMRMDVPGISEPAPDSIGAPFGDPDSLDERSAGVSRLLVPIGGGKDSAVTLALLESRREEIFAFSINPTQAALDTMEVAGIPAERRIIVRRSLDSHMLDMNKKGYWNGHTPFSALVAFVTAFEAYVHRLNYIVLSNESSADESTVPGTAINHQFSKTTAFETSFQHYTRQYLGIKAHYFSFLRPFAEIAIAREFAKHPAYFPVFRSCNVGSKQNVWCGHCAKCLFVACILSPFVSRQTLGAIFGFDILNDASLVKDLEGLCGRVELKPWECVGTVSEVNVALCQTIGQILDSPGSSENLPELLKIYVRWAKAGEVPGVHVTQFGRPITVIDESRGPLSSYNTDHRVPEAFLPYLKGMVSDLGHN